jgi:hypothetical protein
MSYAPIALFSYRRPDHFLRTIEALKACPEFAGSPVFVFSDGPRKAEDVPDVEAARGLARRLLAGTDAIFVESDCNRGLAASIIRFCIHFDRGEYEWSSAAKRTEYRGAFWPMK